MYPGSGMVEPVVSYLVTVFNKEREIVDTLRSIIRQGEETGVPFEVVIVDDCSTDGGALAIMGAAQGDSRIQLLLNNRNLGPSARINQAGRAARGRFFIPVDGDDFLSPNAGRVMLSILRDSGADVVFGRSKRGVAPAPIPESPAFAVIEDPLAYCARRQLVRMGFLTTRDVWMRACGADELVFIQDQSLPLRLCAAASRIVAVDAVTYTLREVGPENLSAQKTQQHHDRFLSAYAMRQHPELGAPALRALDAMALSAFWKLRRDTARLPYLSRAFAYYVANKTLGIGPSAAALDHCMRVFLAQPSVRRIDPQRDAGACVAIWRGDMPIPTSSMSRNLTQRLGADFHG